MKIFAISDNIDTKVGLRLAGVEGVIVDKREEVVEAINKARADDDIGIVVITRRLAAQVPKVIDEMKLSASLPLIVEIPERDLAQDEEADYITKYVRDSIGIKV